MLVVTRCSSCSCFKLSPFLQSCVSSARIHRRYGGAPLGVRMSRRSRLKEAMKPDSGALRFAIDCSIDDYNLQTMSEKELKRLVKQINETFSLTINRPHPLSTLTLTGLEPGGRIEQALRKNSHGFDDCLNLIGKTSKLHYEYYDPKQLIYLSPDSNEVLQEVRNDVVYVLGGIVDFTVRKHLTETIAREQQLVSARLPVPETMTKSNKERGNHVNLPLNIVVGMLVTVYSGSSWSEALSCYLPKRIGYDTVRLTNS